MYDLGITMGSWSVETDHTGTGAAPAGTRECKVRLRRTGKSIPGRQLRQLQRFLDAAGFAARGVQGRGRVQRARGQLAVPSIYLFTSTLPSTMAPILFLSISPLAGKMFIVNAESYICFLLISLLGFAASSILGRRFAYFERLRQSYLFTGAITTFQLSFIDITLFCFVQIKYVCICFSSGSSRSDIPGFTHSTASRPAVRWYRGGGDVCRS